RSPPPPSSWFFLLEQRVELLARGAFRRRPGGSRLRQGRGGAAVGREVLAEIRALLVHHPLRHRLATLIVIGGVVKRAIAAYVQRPIALRTMRVEPDALDRLDPMAALPAVHRQQFTIRGRAIP